jgi:hypothetical protein
VRVFACLVVEEVESRVISVSPHVDRRPVVLFQKGGGPDNMPPRPHHSPKLLHGLSRRPHVLKHLHAHHSV